MTAEVIWPRSAPANAGAHRLAWWIADQADGDAAFDQLAQAAGVSVATIDRFLSGTVDPSGVASAGIERVTRGGVRWNDWYLGAAGPWDERPTPMREDI